MVTGNVYRIISFKAPLESVLSCANSGRLFHALAAVTQARREGESFPGLRDVWGPTKGPQSLKIL